MISGDGRGAEERGAANARRCTTFLVRFGEATAKARMDGKGGSGDWSGGAGFRLRRPPDRFGLHCLQATRRAPVLAPSRDWKALPRRSLFPRVSPLLLETQPPGLGLMYTCHVRSSDQGLAVLGWSAQERVVRSVRISAAGSAIAAIDRVSCIEVHLHADGSG